MAIAHEELYVREQELFRRRVHEDCVATVERLKKIPVGNQPLPPSFVSEMKEVVRILHNLAKLSREN